MQLVQLQQAQKRFAAHGLGLAAISYDSEAILKDFAQRQKIAYPLLSDAGSEIITKFGLLNTTATDMSQGMAHPGFLYVDPQGVVKEKFFEDAYTNRFTAGNLMMKLFPELVDTNARRVEAPHMELRLHVSDSPVGPGSRVSLSVDVALPADVHVYAPGVTGYRPIALELKPSVEFALRPPQYPASKILFLPAIKEKVPVFEGKFKIIQDVVITADRAFIGSLGSGKDLTIEGQLRYQACDRQKCYLPTQVPVSWNLKVVPMDFTRAPEAIRHR
ncbi:MAG: redoxin domain-containing protein [Acidobacteria bacterium]|nr:redoxin domain-containing protein [Acidobacteriota bacterium]